MSRFNRVRVVHLISLAKLRRRGRIARAWTVDTLRWTWRRRAELVLSVAIAGGWYFVTVGIATIGRPRLVWPLSIGLFLLSASGWSLVVTIARDGLYALAREDRNNRTERRVVSLPPED